MRTDLMGNTTDDTCASTDDATSEYSVISAESPDLENMEKLKEKIINQDEKIKLYEATIRDKNDLIKSLHISIELMKENKELAINQLKDQIADLQNALDLSKNLTSNKDNANSAESAAFEKKSTENTDFETLQTKFAESQIDICQLKESNLELKSKIDENTKQMAILEAKSDAEEGKLKARIAELEKNAEIYEAKSKDDDAKLAKWSSNAKSGQSKDAPFILLNHSKVPNITFIEIGGQKKSAIVEDIPGAGPDWMVILRRFDGSLCFANESLSRSFGKLSGEFWFGLDSIHQLTSNIQHELYIQLVDFDDVTAYARYDNFVVGSLEEFYALKSLGAYTGNAGDALRSHVNSKINHEQGVHFLIYWWFSNNNQCCLTGDYKKSKELQPETGMHWGNWCLGQRYSLKACKMLIRPYK